jgi:ligand-binding sensor domain-containing protein
LYRYDGKNLSNITEEKGLGNPEFLKGHLQTERPGTMARVWSINQDAEGNLWIGTIDCGLWKYDGKSLTNYTVRDGLPGNSIRSIFKDRTGDLWFLINGDFVCRYDGSKFHSVKF